MFKLLNIGNLPQCFCISAIGYWSVLCKNGSITLLGWFSFLAGCSIFWQIDLFWHENHHSVITVCASFLTNNMWKSQFLNLTALLSITCNWECNERKWNNSNFWHARCLTLKQNNYSLIIACVVVQIAIFVMEILRPWQTEIWRI